MTKTLKTLSGLIPHSKTYLSVIELILTEKKMAFEQTILKKGTRVLMCNVLFNDELFNERGMTMFSKQEKTKDSSSARSGFNLRMFNPRKPTDIEALNALIDSEITSKDEENEQLKPTFKKMTEWLKRYVKSPEFMAMYPDERSLELIAEATFWAVKLGLEPHLATMSYAEIRKFKPLMERFSEKTERAKLINEVCAKLVKPAMSHEASFALGQAAWCVYVHHNSFEKMKEDEATYDLGESSQQRSRL